MKRRKVCANFEFVLDELLTLEKEDYTMEGTSRPGVSYDIIDKSISFLQSAKTAKKIGLKKQKIRNNRITHFEEFFLCASMAEIARFVFGSNKKSSTIHRYIDKFIKEIDEILFAALMTPIVDPVFKTIV